MDVHSPDRWLAIGSHFASALELPVSERGAYLDRSCATDPALRAAVERLLRAHADSGDFLNRFDAPRVAALLADTDAPDPLPSSIGPYEILRQLGRGGMGVVYLARHTRLDRPVALKLLAPQLGNDPGARKRFLDEARAASAIDHRHIVTVYDVDETAEGTLYIAMAYCEGETLRERLHGGPLPMDDVRRVALQVADALAAAHRRGIVHRDVKPGNIILGADGTAKLLDFGIAALVGRDMERHAAFAGTVVYMSPEQAQGEPPTPAQDVWSFGATLYEAMTGARPFHAHSARELVESIRRADVVPIRDVRPDIPGPLADLVERCLSRTPALRPENGAALLETLTSIEQEERGAHRGVSRPWLTGGGIVAAAMLAVGTLAWWREHRPPPLAPGSAIAILPFSSTGDTALARLGRDLVITVSSNLDDVGELRTIDAQTILAQPEAERPLTTPRERLTLAARLGATSVLHGTLVRTGAAVRLDASLTEAASGRTVARASISGAPLDVAVLTDSLTWLLLRQLYGDARDGRVDAGALTTRSVAALRAFLEGERLVSEGRMRQAPDAFARAFAADSTFWVAYWRYAQARGYWGSPVEPRISRAYREHRHALPLRERLLIEARMTDSVAQRLAAVRTITERFPDYWPGWWDLVERLVHTAPYVGTTRAEAAAALDQLLLLNPKHAPALTHRYWLALLDRDTTSTGRALARLTAMRYDSATADEEGIPVLPLYRFMHDAARRGGVPEPGLARLAVADLAGYSGTIPDGEFAAGASTYGLHQANIELMRQIIALDGVSPGIVAAARRGLAIALASRGDWDGATLAMRDYVRRVDGPQPIVQAYRLASFGEWLGGLPRGAADEWAKPLLRYDGTLPASARAELAWWRGIHAVARRDGRGLSSARAALGAARYPHAQLLDRSLAAFELALAGDTVAAVDAMRELERLRAQRTLFVSPGNEHPYLTAVNRLGASRWLLATGDTLAASELLTWTDAVVAYAADASHVNALAAGYVYYHRAAIEESRGRPERAAVYARRFLERVDAPSSTHRAQIEHATRMIEAGR